MVKLIPFQHLRHLPESDSLLGISLAVVLCFGSFGCSQKSSKPDDVAAEVGAVDLSVEELHQEVNRWIETGRPLAKGVEGVLEEMVQTEALYQKAVDSGLLQDADIQRDFKKWLVGKLRERELHSALAEVKVEEKEIEAEYQARLDRLTLPAKARLAIIFLKYNDKMSDTKKGELRERIEECRRQAILSPAEGGRGAAATGFGALSIEYSEDALTRYRGGDLGWLVSGKLDGRWPEPVLKTGFALEPGEISQVLETENGLYLVKKSDFREAVVTGLEQARIGIQQSLLTQKRRQIQEDFLNHALQRVNVVTYPENFENATWAAHIEIPEGKETHDIPPELPGVALGEPLP